MEQISKFDSGAIEAEPGADDILSLPDIQTVIRARNARDAGLPWPGDPEYSVEPIDSGSDTHTHTEPQQVG